MSKNELDFPLNNSLITTSPLLNAQNQTTYNHDKGVALYYLGKNQEALRCFDKILNQDATNLNALEYKVNILLRMNRHHEAVTTCDEMLKMHPSYILAHYNKVCALAAMGLKEEASNCYFGASKFVSHEAIPCFYKGKALLYLEKKNEAIALFGKAIELNKNYVEAYVQLGNALYASGNPKEANNYFQKVVDIESNYSDAYYGWGKALFAIGKHSEAFQMFNKVLELNPDSPHAYNSAGVVASTMGDNLGAIAFFSKAIKQNPVHALYYCNKGKALNDMGRGEEALKCFNKAESLSQNHSGKLGGGLSPGNIKHINAILSKDRKLLIEKLKLLQEATLEAQEGIKDIVHDDTKSQHILETFERLKRSASEATGEAINGLSFGQIGAMHQKLPAILEKQLDAHQNEMKSLLGQIVQIKHQQSTYRHKLSECEIKVEVHDDILEASGTKAKAEIKAGFDLLKESRPELYAYCKTFYWTAINLFGAYRNLSTDLIQGDLSSETSLKEEILIIGAKKLASYGATIAQGIPFVGGVLGAIDGIIDCLYNAVKENRFDNKVISLNKVIQAKFGTEDDISLAVAKLSLALTYAKEDQIMNFDIINKKTVSGLEKTSIWLKSVVEGMKHTVLPSVELHDKHSPGAMLALADAVAIFFYMCKNSNAIVLNNNPIEKQLASCVEYGDLDKLMNSALNAAFVDVNFKDQEIIEETIALPSTPPSPSEYCFDENKTENEAVRVAGKESHCCCSVS